MLYLSLVDLAKTEYESKYTSRLASKEDMGGLIELVKADGRYNSQFKDESEISAYFEKVFETGHLVLIFDKDVLKAAGAPLVYKPKEEADERIILRFEAYVESKNRLEYIPLVVEIAKECVKSNYGGSLPFVVFTDDVDTLHSHRDFFKKQNPIKSEVIMHYYYLF